MDLARCAIVVAVVLSRPLCSQRQQQLSLWRLYVVSADLVALMGMTGYALTRLRAEVTEFMWDEPSWILQVRLPLKGMGTLPQEI